MAGQKKKEKKKNASVLDDILHAIQRTTTIRSESTLYTTATTKSKTFF